MKRIVVFLFIFMILLGTKYFENSSVKALSNYKKVDIVSSQPLDDFTLKLKNGDKYIYECLGSNSIKKVNDIINGKYIDGAVFYFNSFSFNSFQKQVDFIYQSDKQIQNYDIFYGYSREFSNDVKINGKKINFQLVNNNGEWILGVPLILTGF